MAKIGFSQTITGQDGGRQPERKVIASVIAEALGCTASYAGAPSFGYTAGGWGVSKNAQVSSPAMDTSDLAEVETVLTALKTAELTAKETLLITIHGISELEAGILGSVLKSKETLLKKALQTNQPFTVTYENEEVTLPFFTATLDTDKLCAYLTLAMKLAEFAKTLKYTSAVEKVVDNEKYAFRCFLLRLGFIGEEYKTERKLLLAPMEGNGAYKAKNTEVEVIAI